MSNIFGFGEKIKDYDVRVLNEREVRSGTAILFLFGLISFFQATQFGNFFFMKIFLIAFIVDFAIRLFINPKYSPILILARIFIQNQKVEYTGAPQKRFAWAMGLGIAIIAFIMLVILGIQGPPTCALCFFCLVLLFLETAFGICVGCWMYNLFNKKKAKLCPGGVCEIKKKEDIQKVKLIHLIILGIFVVLMACLIYFGYYN